MSRLSRKRRRGLLWLGAGVYLVLLIASHANERRWTLPVASPPRSTVQIPTMGRDGPTRSNPRSSGVMRMELDHWDPSASSPERLPVIMLHGSPGHGADFAFGRSEDDPTLVEIFTSNGRHVYAPNLPGFAGSIDTWDTSSPLDVLRLRTVPSYSGRAHAHAILAMMDKLGIARAHVVGWSNGGYAAIHAADIAPERIASITMMASVGAQETEGSGSYVFEHAKYALGLLAIGGAGELIPHFGLFASRSERIGWLWNFWDTDQRPAAQIMARLTTPTLILHGRNDFLTADWNAERHHELMPTSRLVMLDASHFIPFMQTEEAGDVFLAHFARHDTPGVEALTGYDNRAPRPERAGLGKVWERLIIGLRGVHWLVWILVLTPLAWAMPRVATVILALLVAAMTLDFGVATGALWSGAAIHLLRDRARRKRPLAWLGGVVTAPLLSLTLVWLLAHGNIITPDDGLLGLAFRAQGLGIVASIALGVLALALARLLLTPAGWRTLRLLPGQIRRLEFWPAWALYAAIAPRLARLAHAHGAMTCTCVNPGIPNGGGIIGESKRDILDALELAGAPILPFIAIEPGGDPQSRTGRLLDAIERDPELGGLPIVLKPDVGQRGAGVRLARTPGDIQRFFETCPELAIAQRYCPGPVEVGVLWVRQREHVAREADEHTLCGRVFSITRKARSEITGDGRSSIARLVSRSPRLRYKRDILLSTTDDPKRVPDPGQRVSLGQLGNHALGAVFTDGADLVTPELERAIDDAARRFRGANGGQLDIGRFDIRCESEDALRLAQGLAIIELNGSTGESTNIYDPGRPQAWALGVLGDQWEAMYALGSERRRLGVKPMRPLALVRLLVRTRSA